HASHPPGPTRTNPSPYTTLFRSKSQEYDGPRHERHTEHDGRQEPEKIEAHRLDQLVGAGRVHAERKDGAPVQRVVLEREAPVQVDRKSTRLNSSHVKISYAVFCL